MTIRTNPVRKTIPSSKALSNLRHWKWPRRMLNLVDEFHVGDEAETSLAKVGGKPSDVRQMNSFSDDPDRPCIAPALRETDAIRAQIDDAARRHARDQATAHDPYRPVDHAVAPPIEIANFFEPLR